jgi:hypothetical protein
MNESIKSYQSNGIQAEAAKQKAPRFSEAVANCKPTLIKRVIALNVFLSVYHFVFFPGMSS